MEEVAEFLGNNSVEDVNWLCSLSESEVDIIFSFKVLVLERAKSIGRDDLAKKFDLKTLRAIGTILMEYFKGQVRNKSSNIDLSEFDALINNCNLLKLNSGSFMPLEELKACIGSGERKKTTKSLVETPRTQAKVALIEASRGKIASIKEDVEV